ncbi:MAG: phosphatidate cytidylyltransferase [Anaerolineales bacterium]
MRRRAVTSVLIVTLGLPGLLIGGPVYFLAVAVFLGIASWEYVDMAHSSGCRASRLLVVGGVVAIIATRAFFPPESIVIFTFSILAAMALHLVESERGRDNATFDFFASVGGLAYMGWVGAYLIDLRTMPDGQWWSMLVLPVVWLADTVAYLIGSRYGIHKMTPRLSPKKTWEGFWAGAISGALTGGFFAFAYSQWGPLHLPVWEGALFGFMIGILTPLGDLGESMFKRQAGMKDSGNFFPGHGGVFDRIDSWLWAAVLGYYFIVWFAR